MGFLKKALKKITGADKAEKKAREEAERQKREAEERARQAAELEAAQKSAMSNVANADDGESKTEMESENKASDKKKTLKGGRKGLTVSRAGGSGINI